MLNDLEASLLRNLENRRQRAIDAQTALAAKLEAALSHMETCASQMSVGQLAQDTFAGCVLKWYELATLLLERAAVESREFTRLAADLDQAEMEEHEPGGYIAQRLNLLNAAQALAERCTVYGEVVTQVFEDWLTVVSPATQAGAAGN